LSASVRARSLEDVTDAEATTAPSDESRTDAQADGPVVFVGDALTGAGPWQDAFPELEIENLGRTGDTTADVFERLDDVIALHPSVVVLMVGTNDFGHRATVEQVVRGTENILWRLHHELPGTRLLVLSVLPRERERAEWIRQVNIHVRQFASAPAVQAEFVDLWPEFAQADGELKPDYTPDRVHLNEAGYSAWADRLRPLLAG
jgi:lysophospholipase L1-like esterase